MEPFNLVNALFVALFLSASAAGPALGQWIVSAEVGADRFWGGSIENAAEKRSFRPYRPTTFGIGLERMSKKVGVGLRLRYASAGLALEGTDLVAAFNGVFKLYSASPELTYRITALGSRNELRLQGGPLFELWSIIDEDSQTRVGVQAALSLRVPLGGRFAGSFAAGGAVTPSPFAENQLGPEFERRTLWRRRVAAGLEYRL